MLELALDSLQAGSGLERSVDQLLNELSLGVAQLSLEGEVVHGNAAALALLEGPGGTELLHTLNEMSKRAAEVDDFVETLLSLGSAGEVRVLLSPARCVGGFIAVLERAVLNRLRAESSALRSMLAAATEAVSPAQAALRALTTLASTLAGSYLVLYELDEQARLIRQMAHTPLAPGHGSVLDDRPLDNRTSLVGRVLQAGRAHHLANLARSFFPAERALPGGEKLAAIALPVRGRGFAVGVLFVCGPAEILGEGELKLIQGLADALGSLVERARQDAALALERNALASLMDNLPDAVLEQGVDGLVSTAGGRLEPILGVGRPALLGRRIGEVLIEDDRRRFEQLVGQAVEGQVSAEVTVLRPDGSQLACEVSAHVSRVDERGPKIRAIFRDITARRALQQEVLRSQALAIRNDRLAAIGQLAAGVAHEINNPLAFVKGNLSVLRDMLSDLRSALTPGASDAKSALPVMDELSQMAEETSVGVARIAAIVKLLKGQSRSRVEELQSFDLEKAVAEATMFFGGATQRTDAVDCQLPPLPQVVGDQGGLGQVVLNLLNNGFDAMGGKGTMTIRASTDGSRVRLTISDRGPGIPEAIRTRIFEPFFTTKGVGKGTGLGLYISHDIVRQSGGALTFETSPKGTTFVIELRCAKPQQ